MSYQTYVDPRAHEDVRAHAGDEVWVVLNHIRAEKREACEYFLNSILMPAAAHVRPDVYNKTRVLHPVNPNEDSTFTYIFLMDPVIPTGVYDIATILHEFYKPELADEYMKIWSEALASPQIGFAQVQSAW
ncbi:MAG: hypothetical protein HY864_00140 [Chloroflexi bacterium]|nr:hypothetical protein [Chloroflexota bacterium]